MSRYRILSASLDAVVAIFLALVLLILLAPRASAADVLVGSGRCTSKYSLSGEWWTTIITAWGSETSTSVTVKSIKFVTYGSNDVNLSGIKYEGYMDPRLLPKTNLTFTVGNYPTLPISNTKYPSPANATAMTKSRTPYIYVKVSSALDLLPDPSCSINFNL